MTKRVLLAVGLVLSTILLGFSACDALEDLAGWDDDGDWGEYQSEPVGAEDAEPEDTESPPPIFTGEINTKWDLWNSGATLLRGANIWQAVVIPEVDGDEFKGAGPVGPPFAQVDFDRLAALGANYVTISGPGLFTEKPPYHLDEDVTAHLDALLEMIAQADMFAVIAFRTGPGRSEYSLCCSEENWAQPYMDDRVWEEQDAQDAWVDMWRVTAERYRDHPHVIGYKLMVEPNAEEIMLGFWEPEEFYPEYAGTLYDWNQFYPRLVAAIRAVDRETPILVGGMSYSRVAWLPYLAPADAGRIVYVVHHYEPSDYTHQGQRDHVSYPDEIWGERFDRDWIDTLFDTVDAFAKANNAPVAVDEFGVVRWAPNAESYLADMMGIFEGRGLNYAIWEWSTSYVSFVEEINDFTLLFGKDAGNTTKIDNPLMEVVKRYWAFNTVRPSTVPWTK